MTHSSGPNRPLPVPPVRPTPSPSSSLTSSPSSIRRPLNDNYSPTYSPRNPSRSSLSPTLPQIKRSAESVNARFHAFASASGSDPPPAFQHVSLHQHQYAPASSTPIEGYDSYVQHQPVHPQSPPFAPASPRSIRDQDSELSPFARPSTAGYPTHPSSASNFYTNHHKVRPTYEPGSAEQATQQSLYTKQCEQEERDKEEALIASLNGMELEEDRDRLLEAEEERIFKRAQEESVKMELSRQRNSTGWETWEIGIGNGTYEGLHTNGQFDQSDYYHQPPPPGSDQKEDPGMISTGLSSSDQHFNALSSSSKFFEDEFKAHAEIIQKLKDWQSGLLPAGLEWYELIPNETRTALSEKEVERQGLIWEIFRSEQEYVKNLEGGLNGYFTPIATVGPRLMPPEKVPTFIADIFHNINSIFPKHSKMVYHLQERQLESHPVVQSISDILIINLFDLLGDYEKYLKHYPYAEARLRREITKNHAFKKLVDDCGRSELVRKQDLASFLVSPLSRLSKLALALQRLLKITPNDHEDKEQIPVILELIDGMLRAVQPGVDAATAKVQAWHIAQRLRFRKGERNDLNLDLPSNQRALLYSGKVYRRQRNERDFHGWTDLFLILFDNYLLITKEETKSGGHPNNEEDTTYAVVSRPLPLEYLRLVGSENDPGEHRRDMIVDYQRKKPIKLSTILEPLVQPDRTVYPFHIEHKGNGQAYSLYVDTVASRKEWVSRLKHQITVRKVTSENNALYSMHTLTYSPRRQSLILTRPLSISRATESTQLTEPETPYLRTASSFSAVTLSPSSHRSSIPSVPSVATPKLGLNITCAGSFVAFGKRSFAVADSNGISIGYRDDAMSHRCIIESSSIIDLFVLQDLNRILVVATGTLYSYDLGKILVDANPDNWKITRKESGEVLSAWGENVNSVCKIGYREEILQIVYSCYNKLVGQTTLKALELVDNKPSRSQSLASAFHRQPKSNDKSKPATFRTVAEAVVSGPINNIGFFEKYLSLPTDKNGVIILDLMNPTRTISFPNISESSSSNPTISGLKHRVTSYSALLMHRISENAFLIVYETGGTWVDKQGSVLKDGAYITWEARAASAVVQGSNIVLFSKDGNFIEVRSMNSGRLLQVIETQKVRLISDNGPDRLVMGCYVENGQEKPFELAETVALPPFSEGTN
ncbi:RhoGEF GTPase [Phaffia rhodozyma]|uniref:RhoGEF GTPase n=1 Tax=Phaffia rhodozyma TaxID=264483 RepID=A0A0F7SRK2_PHARH|nr:RhoGEF GTPase [Phaffia rhodozyma]